VRRVGYIAYAGEIRNVCEILVGQPEGKRLYRRPKHRWEDNINKDLREIRWKGVGWIHLTQDKDQQQALVNMIINIWVP
jgi:hypothetical protein